MNDYHGNDDVNDCCYDAEDEDDEQVGTWRKRLKLTNRNDDVGDDNGDDDTDANGDDDDDDDDDTDANDDDDDDDA